MTTFFVFALLVDTYPQIGFENRPTYVPNNVLALTFDDGPDSVDSANPANSDNTRKVLDVLRSKGVHATFFINTNNYTDVTMDDQAKLYIQRMLNEGHEIANHTVHHAHLGAPNVPNDPGAPSAADIEAEIAGVGAVLKMPSVLGNCAPRLSLFRAPYGEPYQPPNDTTPRYGLVAPIVARHAVEIGWAIDSFDYNCSSDPNGPGDPDCVYNNFVGAVATPGNGNYGIVLMHSVQPQTAAALPRILDYIEQHGFVLKSVEDMVRAKFGMSSGELVADDGSGGPGGGTCGQGGTGGDGGTGGNPGMGDGGGAGGAGGSGGTAGNGSGSNGVYPSGGCGCELVHGDHAGEAALVALLVGLALFRRRR